MRKRPSIAQLTKFSYAVIAGKHLPAIDGPKTAPFRPGGRADIEFIRVLGDTLQSCVMEVRIEGAVYALKMVWPGQIVFGDPKVDLFFLSSSSRCPET